MIMGDLVVELYGSVVGKLVGDWRTFDFVTNPEAAQTFGIDSPILSLAIPLAPAPTRARKDRRQNFFRELLPEEQMLSYLAKGSGLAEHDAIGLLTAFGRDLSGALQIWDPDLPGEPLQPQLQPLSEQAVATMLRGVRQEPLGNQIPSGKTSLAGVQDKIVLVRTDDRWSRALDGWPSSHIAKPESQLHPSMIYDEEYGARIARALGLTSFASWIEEFDDVPAIVIERYDRSSELPEGRIHQEDFNQALGASGNQKYQKFGGRVSLGRIAQVLSDTSDRNSRERLFKLVVLSVAIGNLDLHAKNVSLLHHPDGSMELAPAYDVVPQAHQPNDQQLALSVGDEYHHAAITANHLVAEGQSWGLADAGLLAETTLRQIVDVVSSEDPDPRAYHRLVDDISLFASNLLAGQPVGERNGS
ncbi:MAG: HipA domain-containing protein [Actinomycetes bacterium]